MTEAKLGKQLHYVWTPLRFRPEYQNISRKKSWDHEFVMQDIMQQVYKNDLMFSKYKNDPAQRAIMERKIIK